MVALLANKMNRSRYIRFPLLYGILLASTRFLTTIACHRQLMPDERYVLYQQLILLWIVLEDFNSLSIFRAHSTVRLPPSKWPLLLRHIFYIWRLVVASHWHGLRGNGVRSSSRLLSGPVESCTVAKDTDTLFLSVATICVLLVGAQPTLLLGTLHVRVVLI